MERTAFSRRPARPPVQADGPDAPLDCGVLHAASGCLFEPGQSRTPSAVWPGGQPCAYQPGACAGGSHGTVEGTCEKKLTEQEPVWQEGIGSLLLLAAAHQTGLLATLGTTIQSIASTVLPSGLPLNLAVVERLMLTLLFLPVAGLARTWDLRTYTGTMLALLTGRGCAYSNAYVEQFLSRLARAGADEHLTDAVAQWTWALWHNGQTQEEQEREEQRAVSMSMDTAKPSTVTCSFP